MRIALLCQHYHPEIGAPSARLSSLAKDFRALGHEVVVLTAMPNHPTGIIPHEYRGRWIAHERTGDGTEVLRCRLYATPNEGFFKKTLSHISFMFSALLLGGPRLGRIDVLIVSSPPFLAAISGWLIALSKGTPFVFEVRDLWPAIFVELGVLRNRVLLRILEAVELFLYRRAAAVVTVTDSFRNILIRRGIPQEKILTVTNGVDLDDFQPGPPNAALRKELELDGRFVVLYIGAHGISHALESILRAAEDLKSERDIVFLFVGEGARKRALLEFAQKHELSNVRFLPGQPRQSVADYYRLAHACLVPLRDIPLFSNFIPSKMFEIMACGRPILASLRGEAERILQESGAAVVVPPEDPAALARELLRLKSDPALCTELGGNGSAHVRAHYQRRDLAGRYVRLLLGIVQGMRPKSQSLD